MNMRALIVTIAAIGICATPTTARDGADDVRKLEAEVARLRDENARLRRQIQESADAAAEAKKMEGAWVIETARMDGKDIPSDRGGAIEFIGNGLVAKMPVRKEAIRLTVRIYSAGKVISFLPVEPLKLTDTSFDRWHGRYEWDGDSLRVSLLGYGIPREVSDKNQVLWVLRRKKS
jgi:outer membrane murein-binding lipoprotein Lpp